jgi:hypothetical protein
MISSDTKLFGDGHNIPPRLTSHGRTPTTEIIYWSTPNHDAAVCQALYCQTAGPLILLPCFWPHLLILTPFLSCCSLYGKSVALSTSAVLKATSLELIQDNGTVTNIPLESIKSITVTTKVTPECLMRDVSRLIIDDGRVVYTKNGQRPDMTTLWGHDNIEEFRDRILEAKERRVQMTAMTQMTMIQGNMAAQMQMGMQPMMINQQQQPVMQQGMMYPAGGQPSMAYSSFEQSAMAYPSAGQPVVAYPSSSQPSLVSATQPAMMMPSYYPSNTVHPEPLTNSNPNEYPKRS